MAIGIDQVVRIMRSPRSGTMPDCIVCRRKIGDPAERMTLRGAIHVHRGCATYRMRHVDSGVARLGYPPR